MSITVTCTWGVDPGLSGALAFVFKAGGAFVYDMPTIELKGSKAFVKREVDGHTVAAIFNQRQQRAPLVIEQVNAFPGQGVAGMFSLGGSFHRVMGVADGLYKIIHRVPPGTWKAHFKLGRDKNDSLALAQNLYPWVELSKAKHHGRAEALLIARYALDTGLVS